MKDSNVSYFHASPAPLQPLGLALWIIVPPSTYRRSLLNPLPNSPCALCCLPLLRQAPSPHQPSLVAKHLQKFSPLPVVSPFRACHSLLDFLQADICLQVTHQSLTPNKYHLVASLRQPGQQPPLPAFINVFHLESSPLVYVVPGSLGSSLTSLNQAQLTSPPS